MSFFDDEDARYLDTRRAFDPTLDEVATPIFLTVLSGDTRIYYGDYRNDLEPLLAFHFGDKDLRRGYGTDDPAAGKDPQEAAVDIAIARGALPPDPSQDEAGAVDVVESIRWLIETYRYERAARRLWDSVQARVERGDITDEDIADFYQAQARSKMPKKKRRPYRRAGKPAPAAALAAIEKMPQGTDRRAACLLLWQAGLRLTEALAVTWADLMVEPGYLYLVRAKTRKEDMVPISPMLETELCALLKARKRTGGVDPGDKVVEVNRDALQKWLQRNLDIGAHQLRHAIGYELGRTLDIDQVAKFLGHSSTKTTERYRHATAEDIGRALGWSKPETT